MVISILPPPSSPHTYLNGDESHWNAGILGVLMAISLLSLCMSICNLWNMKLLTILSVSWITLSSVSGVRRVSVPVRPPDRPPAAMVMNEDSGVGGKLYRGLVSHLWESLNSYWMNLLNWFAVSLKWNLNFWNSKKEKEKNPVTIKFKVQSCRVPVSAHH